MVLDARRVRWSLVKSSSNCLQQGLLIIQKQQDIGTDAQAPTGNSEHPQGNDNIGTGTMTKQSLNLCQLKSFVASSDSPP